MVRKKFSQKVNHPGDKTSLCNLYLFAHTLVATCWRTMFILERDLQPAVYTCARTHEWSRPRERPRAAELCEGKSNQASGIGSTKKNGRIWNFPRKRPPFVDADRAKNRRPQCTSIFIRPPFPPFCPSLFLSLSRTTWSHSPLGSFGGTATSDFVPFCLRHGVPGFFEVWMNQDSAIIN